MKKEIPQIILFLSFFVTMISCAPSTNDDLVKNEIQIMDYRYNSNEIALIRLINQYRNSLNLNSLAIINHISFKSQEHNNYMIQNHVVNHDFFQERSENIIHVLGAVKVHENVAYNFISPSGALHAWLNSPGHRANIEGNFSYFGLSVTTSLETGKKYYTVIFMSK